MSEYAQLGQITCSKNDFKFNDKKNGVDKNQPTVVEGFKYRQPVGKKCNFHSECNGFGPDTSIECVQGQCTQRKYTGCS